MRCPECGGGVVFNGKEYVCEDCGCVIGYPIDYRTGARERESRHHGPLIKLEYSDFGISTDIMGANFSIRQRRLNKSKNRAIMRDLLNVIDGYPKHVQQQTIYLARKVCNDRVHYKKKSCFLKALLLVACRITNYPLTVKDLASKGDRKYVLRYAKMIMARYGLRYDHIKLGLAFLRKCCDELNIDFKKAYDMFLRVSRLCDYHKPNAVAGAVAYYVSGTDKLRIAKTVRVCTMTITKIASEIDEIINS